MKPTVHYLKTKYDCICEGASAYVHPVDHPDTDNVSNTKMVCTSKVIKVTQDGFETQNTIYKVQVGFPYENAP